MSLRMTIEYALRPCIAYGNAVGGDPKKALFHRWVDVAEVIPPSPLRSGHGGGQVWGVCGLVEFEDGGMHMIEPRMIVFIDNMHSNYAWEEEKHD